MAQPLPPPQSGDDREDQAALIAAAVTAVFATAEAALVASIASAVRRALTTAIAGATAAIGQRLGRQSAAILAVAEQRAARIVAQTGLDPVPEAVTEALESASEHAYEEAGSVYREVVDAAIAETRGGLPYSSLSLSRIQAAQKVLDDLLGKGITGFTDSAGRKWDLASYVEMATRTAVSNAYDDHLTRGLLAGGVDLVLVGTHSTEGSCPLCVVPGTLIEGPAPEWSARLEYRGDVVSITTASGRNLTGTPDHTVLTPQGWRRLKDLLPGDEVISNTGQQLALHPASLEAGVVVPDHIQVPTLVEEVGKAVAPLLLAGPARRDLDGNVAYREVHAVWPDRFLVDEWDAPFCQPAGDPGLVFGIGTTASLTGLSDLDLVFQGALASPGSGVGRAGDAGSLLRRVGLPGSALSLGSPLVEDVGVHGIQAALHDFVPGAYLRAGPEQVGVGRCCADTEYGREFGGACTSLVALDEFGGLGVGELASADAIGDSLLAVRREDCCSPGVADMESGHELIKRLAGTVAPDKVLNVSVRQFSGHVWDLHTAPNWYSSNGIVSHNCTPYLGHLLSVSGATSGFASITDVAGAIHRQTVMATLAEAKAAGFRHPNCRCTLLPFHDGANLAEAEMFATPRARSEAEYKASQRTRALERRVRAAGRRQQLAITPQAKGKARRDVAAARAASAAHRAAHGVRQTQVGVRRREHPYRAR